MNCLIVGGGFISTHLALHLYLGHHSVTVISAYPRPIFLSTSINWIESSLELFLVSSYELSHFTHVYFLSSIPVTIKDGLTRLLYPQFLSLFNRLNPYVKFIYFSSASIYGNQQSQPISELQVARPVSPYGQLKLAHENALMLIRSSSSATIHIIRISTVFGPSIHGTLPKSFLNNLIVSSITRQPLFLVSPKSTQRDYIFISDLCSAVLSLSCVTAPFILNIGSPCVYNLDAIVALFRSLIDPSIITILDTTTFPTILRCVLDRSLSLQYLPPYNTTTFEDGLHQCYNSALQLYS